MTTRGKRTHNSAFPNAGHYAATPATQQSVTPAARLSRRTARAPAGLQSETAGHARREEGVIYRNLYRAAARVVQGALNWFRASPADTPAAETRAQNRQQAGTREEGEEEDFPASSPPKRRQTRETASAAANTATTTFAINIADTKPTRYSPAEKKRLRRERLRQAARTELKLGTPKFDSPSPSRKRPLEEDQPIVSAHSNIERKKRKVLADKKAHFEKLRKTTERLDLTNRVLTANQKAEYERQGVRSLAFHYAWSRANAFIQSKKTYTNSLEGVKKSALKKTPMAPETFLDEDVETSTLREEKSEKKEEGESGKENAGGPKQKKKLQFSPSTKSANHLLEQHLGVRKVKSVSDLADFIGEFSIFEISEKETRRRRAQKQKDEEERRTREKLEREAKEAKEKAEREERERLEKAKREKEAAERRARRLVRPLSAASRRAVDAAVTKGSDHAAVIIENPILSGHDLSTLLGHMYARPGNDAGWLNDTIVDNYTNHVVERAQTARGFDRAKHLARRTYKATPPVLSLGSTWFGRASRDLASTRPQTARSHLNGKNLLEAEAVLVPICSGSHWTLLVVRPRARVIEYLDSMSGVHPPSPSPNPLPALTSPQARRAVDLARAWLEFELGPSLYKADEWKEVGGRSPQQNNGRDCGAFVCMNVLAVGKGVAPREGFGQKDMAEARMMIAGTLLEGGLSGEFDWNV